MRSHPLRQIFALSAMLLSGLLLLLTLYGATVQGQETTDTTMMPMVGAISDPAVYFTANLTRTEISLAVTPMEQALLDRINGASIAIDAAFYDFNRQSIYDALIAAHNRGLSVRIVTDDETRFHVASYIPFYDGLEEAGMVVIDDDLESAIMHDKYFIIDGEYVWSGSTNMSNNGFTLNHNNGLLFRSTELADLYQIDFNQMWAGLFSSAKTEPLTTTLSYSGHPLDVYFSPTSDVIEQMITLVNSATVSIDFAIFFFTDDDLRDALIGAHQRGVQVRGLWDALGSANSFSEDEALCEAGVSVKVEGTTGKMHHKFMVIDAATLNARTVTGSLNWTGAGNRRNSENTLVLHDPVIAQAYADAFQTMWASQGPEAACLALTQTFIPLVIDTSQAIVRIASILYNPDGDDFAEEHVRIHNVGGSPIELTGWTLRDVADNTYTFPAVTIQPSQVITIWTQSGVDNGSNLYWGRSGSAIWNNGGDTAWLYSADGIVKDVCAYAGGGIEVECD